MVHPAVFLVGCVGVRLLAAYLAYYLLRKPPAYLRAYGLLLLVPAVGFALIYAMGWRKTGPETSGGPIWWNALRPVHAALYLAAALSALASADALRALAWKLLLADVALGVVAYLLRSRGLKDTP
jgi:hypothetical protein